MSRYFRITYQLQRHFRRVTSLKHSGSLYSCGHIIPIDVVASLPSQVNYFSVRTPTILDKDEEKFSDSDSESDEERKQDDLLDTVVRNGKPLSSEEWEGVKAQSFMTLKGVNSYNVDAIVMSTCIKHKQLNVGHSYLEHLSQIKKKPNIATVQHFMRLCYNCKENAVNEQIILSMYDELRTKYPVLDASTCESMILALCLTSRWKEGLELLDMAKLTSHPGGLEYGVLAKAAFDNNEANLSKKLIDEMLDIGRQPRPEVYHAWLDYLDRLSEGNKQYRWTLVEETLKILVENDLKPTLDVVEKLKLWFEEAGTEHKGSLSTLTGRGVCRSCQRSLNPIKISVIEFDSLRSSFLERVMIGKDIFTRTTPGELDEFKKFVKYTAPYDIVIDGLNVAYATGQKKHMSKNGAFTLEQVVRHFVTKSKKVLVLGRKHMKSWNKHSMDYVYKNSSVFLAEDMSQDDPFLLYAALYSGLGTYFVSKDLMRTHSYLLQNKALRSTFRKWQLQHQYQVKYITQTGKVHLKFPLTFNPMAQKNRDGFWHIPYEMEFSANPAQLLEAPSLWLCLNPQSTSRVPRYGRVF